MQNPAPLPHAQYGALGSQGAPGPRLGDLAPMRQTGGRASGMMKPGGEIMPLLKKKKPDALKPMVVNIIFQPIIFTITYYVFSFIFRADIYNWMIPYAWCIFLILLAGAIVFINRRSRQPDPWLSITAGFVITTMIMGGYYGNENYANMKYYYTFRGMATYVNINPARDSGRGFADAGEIYFKEGSRIDYARAVAFKNTDLFCAAPIIMVDPEGEDDAHEEPLSYDFWVVGTNCCNPSGEAFTCGDQSTLTRSGMRVLEQIDIPYYHFAVHQFTAKFLLPADNPLFFSWTLDPLGAVATKHLNANLNFHEAVYTFFFINMVILFLARFSLIQLNS